MIKTKLVKNNVYGNELHIWVERDFNAFELKELIDFIEFLRGFIQIELMDSVEYPNIKSGWKLRMHKTL